MPQVNRRRFLTVAGGAVAATMLNESIARAAAIPASRKTGTIRDVEHIVILMQENRSFDHYFGTLRGVRGFGDPHPATQPNGKSVFYQSDGTKDILPFRPQVAGDDLSLYFVEDLDHSWYWTHNALNNGAWDRWIASKGTTTMAHYERKDASFHYALADAFTICDNYFCSLLGPTDPNRSYMWTGWVGNDGADGIGPMTGNFEPDSHPGATPDEGFRWKTYPERLEAAGVSWKVYQDEGQGLDPDHYFGWGPSYEGNYGDNALLYFQQYNAAAPGSPLYEKARTGTRIGTGDDKADAAAAPGLFQNLRDDVANDRLPQVSWIVAPESYTEHPQWPTGYGAWYIANALNALTSNPDVWSKTALIITYDENDGFFDHVVSPVPNVGAIPGKSTVALDNEYFDGTKGLGKGDVPGPFGLGVRVPTIVVSPWSTGGYVTSEVFDHTSLIKFIEKRFGVVEPQITPWRRAMTGDLTSAFDFSKNPARPPRTPDLSKWQPTGTDNGADHPAVPADGELPKQEPGVRPARRLGYNLAADVTFADSTLKLTVRNSGSIGAHVYARSLALPNAPFSYSLGKQSSISDQWTVSDVYDLELHGPNGFFRYYAGSPASPVSVHVRQTGSSEITFDVSLAPGHAPAKLTVDDAYGRTVTATIRGGRATSFSFRTTRTGGWYDVTFTNAADPDFVVTAAGRLETSDDLTSDPQFGGNRPRPRWRRNWEPRHQGSRGPLVLPPAGPRPHGKQNQQFGPAQ
jgi:phospholipase C